MTDDTAPAPAPAETVSPTLNVEAIRTAYTSAQTELANKRAELQDARNNAAQRRAEARLSGSTAPATKSIAKLEEEVEQLAAEVAIHERHLIKADTVARAARITELEMKAAGLRSGVEDTKCHLIAMIQQCARAYCELLREPLPGAQFLFRNGESQHNLSAPGSPQHVNELQAIKREAELLGGHGAIEVQLNPAAWPTDAHRAAAASLINEHIL